MLCLLQEASAQETATRESLQDALDKLCRVEAEAACKSGLSHYCNMPVYARYDGRSNNVNSKEWRCYTEDALNFEVARASCVDTCGKLKMCLGAYGGSSTSYLSRHGKLSSQLDELKPKYCSAPAPTLQEALDRKCAGFGEEACKQGLWAYCNVTMYARYDVGTASQKAREWRCYAQDALDFDISGSGCVDDCGNFTSCRGAVNGSSSTHLSRVGQLMDFMNSNKDFYCPSPTEEAPVESEDVDSAEASESTTLSSNPTSNLQSALDKVCAEEGKKACEQGLKAYCDADMFARHDVGTGSQRNREWRCYARESLDFGISGDGCVDDCGNATPCPGAVNGTSTTHLSRDAQVGSAINANKDEFCGRASESPAAPEESVEVQETTAPPSSGPSQLQEVLDNLCAEEGRRACQGGLSAYCEADMFARHDVGTEQQRTREWRCYAQPSLDFDISGDGCVDDCGNITSCLGAVNGTSTAHLSRNAQVASAIDANKGEFCGRTSESPAASEKEESVEVQGTTTTPPSGPLRMQHFVDEFCLEEAKRACQNGLSAYCDATVIARHDVGTEQQRTKEWRCYVIDSLDFDLSGDGCVDDCGNIISCHGAVNGTSTTHLTRDDAVNTAIDSKLDEFCNPTSESPEASEKKESVEVPETTALPSNPPSNLQALADGLCAEEGRKACGQGLQAYCDTDMFARHDVGTGSQRNREWRCYARESLDFGISGDGCVDDCGNLTSCLGAVNGSSTTHLSRGERIQKLIDTEKAGRCTPEEGEEAGGSPAPAPVPEVPAGVPASEVSDKGLKVPPRVRQNCGAFER